MSRAYVPASLERRVRDRAGHRCIFAPENSVLRFFQTEMARFATQHSFREAIQGFRTPTGASWTAI
jgi:hypothetical protein